MKFVCFQILYDKTADECKGLPKSQMHTHEYSANCTAKTLGSYQVRIPVSQTSVQNVVFLG